MTTCATDSCSMVCYRQRCPKFPGNTGAFTLTIRHMGKPLRYVAMHFVFVCLLDCSAQTHAALVGAPPVL